MNLERRFNSDLNIDLEKQRGLLGQILEAEKIKSGSELRETALRYCLSYHEKGDKKIDRWKTIWNEERRMRMFLIKQIIKWLYLDKQPANIIECGSAGDISIALALPQTQVVSVDIDPLIFLNVPYNTLPDKFFTKLGREQTREGYGTEETGKLALVEQLVPNWKKEIADAKKLPFTDQSFDAAWVQGTPDLLDFLPEMARVVKPSGHIVASVEEVHRGNFQSAYETKKYESYKPEFKFKFVTSKTIDGLGLEAVNIPEQFKNYESLCTWQSIKGTKKSFGFVFEVFKKK